MAALSALSLWFMASHKFHIKDAGPATSGYDLVGGYLAVERGCVLLLLAVIGISRKLPPVLIYLGRISFGLYVFHALGLHIASAFSHKMNIPHLEIAEPVLGFGLTIAFAALSYRFYETPFLKLKKRLEVIKTEPV